MVRTVRTDRIKDYDLTSSGADLINSLRSASIYNKLTRLMDTADLIAMAKAARDLGIKPLMREPSRVAQFTFEQAGIYADLSKTHLTHSVITAYAQIAREIGLERRREAQFAGEKINSTEGRAVLHTLLRDNSGELADARDRQVAKDAQSDYLDQIELLRNKHLGADSPIKSIVHIGIGGSSLGPQLLYQALAGLDNPVNVHFVSNIDAHEVLAVLNQCEPESTLVFGVSKTFTTAETLMNIRTVQSWVSDKQGVSFAERFFAVTASHDNALEFGVEPDNIIVFPEWVGGRYSIWSAVSLSVALVLGREAIDEFLSGAAQVDAEFLATELPENLPFLLACLDHYYSNYFDAGSRATFAYDNRLTSLVPYLQQLETESNGKDRDLNGEPVQSKTSAVIWGGTGTDMQHSTFQMLHQGTNFTPVEFILVRQAAHDLQNHHNALLANGVAQSAALLAGRTLEEVQAMPENQDLPEAVQKSKVFAGNKPSTTFLLESLTPFTLGALLALYEHRTFCAGVLSGINSFDQMGVELGKQLANEIEPALRGESIQADFDASTMQLIAKILGRVEA